MEYSKRYISLPKELNDKLAKEVNASGTVAQALIAHYEYKDNLRRLASEVSVLNSHLRRLEPPEDEQREGEQRYEHKVLRPGTPEVKVDNQEGLYYDPYIKQWKPLETL